MRGPGAQTTHPKSSSWPIKTMLRISQMVSLNHLMRAYESARSYIEFVQTNQWMESGHDVSEFWSKFLSSRRNYPTFNEIQCLRRGYTYPLGDRGGANLDLQQEHQHARQAFATVTGAVPECYFKSINESSIGAPLAFNFEGSTWSGGGLINALTAHRIVHWCRQTKIDGDGLRILEIGAGYGQVAHQLFQQLKIKSYAICDLPENLFLSSFYLQAHYPTKTVEFVRNKQSTISHAELMFMVPPLLKGIVGEFDLIINSYSFQEMNLESVKEYFEFASQRLSADGFFYSLNSHGKAGVLRPQDYPIGHFAMHSFQSVRRHPAQIFATTPYELVLKRKAVDAAPRPEPFEIGALGYLCQLGLFEDINPLGVAVADHSATPNRTRWLEQVCDFFESREVSSKNQILRNLLESGEETRSTTFLYGASIFAQGDWLGAITTLPQYLEIFTKNHASLLAHLIIYTSALNLGRIQLARSSMESACQLFPEFKKEILYWKRNPDGILSAVAQALRYPKPNRLKLRSLVAKAKEKLRLVEPWRKSVGY